MSRPAWTCTCSRSSRSSACSLSSATLRQFGSQVLVGVSLPFSSWSSSGLGNWAAARPEKQRPAATSALNRRPARARSEREVALAGTGADFRVQCHKLSPGGGASPQGVVFSNRNNIRARNDTRSSANSEKGDKPVVFENMCIDPLRRSVTVHDKPIILTAKEFDLLWLFARHPEQVFTREQLLNLVWGYEFYGDASTVTCSGRSTRDR